MSFTAGHGDGCRRAQAGGGDRFGCEAFRCVSRSGLTVGVLKHPEVGEVFAYEVDGFGSAYFMDDANIPSLLSLPYLGKKG